MKFRPLQKRNRSSNENLARAYAELEKLLQALDDKYIPERLINIINHEIDEINHFHGSDEALIKKLQQKRSKILSVVRRKLNLKPQTHNRNKWSTAGLFLFTIPLAVGIAILANNPLWMIISLPLGLLIGLGIGLISDHYVRKKGKQIELKD